MTVAPSADNIAATIEGENRGQIAVGKHILQVHAEAGAIVSVAKQGGPDPTWLTVSCIFTTVQTVWSTTPFH